jgi:hypothetical protein
MLINNNIMKITYCLILLLSVYSASIFLNCAKENYRSAEEINRLLVGNWANNDTVYPYVIARNDSNQNVMFDTFELVKTSLSFEDVYFQYKRILSLNHPTGGFAKNIEEDGSFCSQAGDKIMPEQLIFFPNDNANPSGAPSKSYSSVINSLNDSILVLRNNKYLKY